MAIRSWKVYGIEGHRQRESFNDSYNFTVERNGSRLIVDVWNSDMTGTNEYTLIRITGPSSQACLDELNGQLSDGIFENSRVGKVEEFDTIVYAVQYRDNYDWDYCFDNHSDACDAAVRMCTNPKHSLDEIRIVTIDNINKVALCEQIFREGLR